MKRMIRATSTRERISGLEKKIDKLRDRLADPDLDEDERIDLGLELAEAEEQLNFAWQDDEEEYNYAVQQQEFNPDGSLKGYDDEVEAATGVNDYGMQMSQCSFDFINDGLYDNHELEDMIVQAFLDAGVYPTAVDFRSVDYSGYSNYEDRTVSQCGVDFEWSERYHEDAIEDEVASALDYCGYELIGISFNSLE